MTAAAARRAVGQTSTRKRAPVKAVADLPSPDEVAKPKPPYPKGTKVFSYKPKDGGAPILLAMDGFERPDKVWLFDLSRQPILSQTWKWMERAGVPRDIQRRACALPDSEYFDMFDAWFEAMKGGATAGE